MINKNDKPAGIGLSVKEAERVYWINRANIERVERAMAMVRGTAAQRKKHEAQRAARKQCKACYYLRGATISGQAFTEYTCQNCQEPQRHHNTSVPRYCPSCCEANELCQTCSGSLMP